MMLRIATMAVTSAGKSTIVNAIAGHELAPISKKEKSAGTVRIRHGNPTVFQASHCRDSGIEPFRRVAVPERPIPDSEIYTTLDGIMDRYYQACQTGEPEMPRAEIEINMLVGNDESLLGLPPGVGVELVDLPGFNATNGDDRNLKHLIDIAAGCFIVIIIDYNDTTSRNTTIFERMSKAINAVKKDGADLLIVINKYLSCDRHDARTFMEDLEIQRNKIQEVLQLQTAPPVVLVEGRLWNNGQLSWGANSVNAPATATDEMRQKCLMDIAKHYSGFIEEFVAQCPHEDVRQWWHQQGKVARLSGDNLRFFLERIVWPLSGADQFFAVLRHRVQSRLGALILRPVFRQAFADWQTAFGHVTGAVEVGCQRSLEAVESVRAALVEKLNLLQREIDGDCSLVKEICDGMTDVLSVKSGGSTRASERFALAITGIKPGYQSAARAMWKIIEDLRKNSLNELYSSVLDPLKPIKTAKDAGAIPDASAAKFGLSAKRARALAIAYGEYQQEVSSWSSHGDERTIEYKADSPPAQVADAESSLEKLGDALCDAVRDVMRFFLRLQATRIEDALKEMLKALQTAAEETAEASGFASALFGAVIGKWFTESLAEKFKIPSSCFEIAMTAGQKEYSKFEVVGTRQEEYRVWWTLWLAKSTRTVNRYGNVEYKQTSMPGEVKIRSDCVTLVDKEMDRIAALLGEWTKDALQSWQVGVSNAREEFLKMIDDEVSAYRNASESHLRQREQEWATVGAEARRGSVIANSIEGMC